MWAGGRLQAARGWVLAQCPGCGEIGRMVFDLAAKYLGVWLGPGAFPRFWKEALDKYLKRLTTWFLPKVGHFFLVRTYN